MDLEDIIVWIIVGAIAGFLASLVVPGVGLGLLGYIVVGILGALVGGWLLGMAGVRTGGGFLGSILVSFVGAVILLVIFVLIF